MSRLLQTLLTLFLIFGFTSPAFCQLKPIKKSQYINTNWLVPINSRKAIKGNIVQVLENKILFLNHSDRQVYQISIPNIKVIKSRKNGKIITEGVKGAAFGFLTGAIMGYVDQYINFDLTRTQSPTTTGKRLIIPGAIVGVIFGSFKFNITSLGDNDEENQEKLRSLMF